MERAYRAYVLEVVGSVGECLDTVPLMAAVSAS